MFWSLDTLPNIVTGLLTGLVFGFLLQKGHVTRYAVIVGQFLLKDFTVLKIMGTAIVVGAIGVWAMRALGWVDTMHIKGAALAATASGAAIFAVGMVLLGYCPGTGVAAVADGSRHAIPGLLGMVVGGAAFAWLYPAIQGNFMKLADVTLTLGDKSTDKITLADLAGVSPWVIIVPLALAAAVGFYLMERKRSAA
jgi:hypothetical protein